MPLNYLNGDWVLSKFPDGAWSIETVRENGLIDTVIAQRAPFAHRATESVATGQLFWASPKLYEACRTYLENRKWAKKAAASDGPESQDTLRQYAEMQAELDEQMLAAVADAERVDSQLEGAA